MTAPELMPEDLRAAVQAGIVTEAQAASLKALIDGRAGRRAQMPAEDEPFEFFRGFSEIFISLGLILLMAGIVGILVLAGGAVVLIALPLIVAAIAFWWAFYFTRKRRMNLPSMVLAIAYGSGVWLGIFAILLSMDLQSRAVVLVPSVVAVLAMAVWYRVFRLPFSAFILGLFALAAVYTATASVDALGGFIEGSRTGFGGFFDLRESPAFALATLGFGLAAFVAGMWFDLKDPHRLGRHAATGFWLHMLAAPALVNTIALTLYNTGGGLGIALLAGALVAITLLALIIDRRSFLTAAIGYIAIVITWLLGGEDLDTWVAILILLGAFITAIGTWWVQLRAALLRALPDFPGKRRLPPWAAA
ncbi:hypothetical protein [Neotabrizicola sp. VNH66]|uniref:hypothetical protein n=1 Tax=Neotabrizicola sp. VNH66 TaxID=3400918 RepID=UPI003BFF3B0A